MPMFPVVLLLLVRASENSHHSLEGLVGWSGGHTSGAHSCPLARGICCAGPGAALSAAMRVGALSFLPYGLHRLSDAGYMLGVDKVHFACHPALVG